MATSFYHVRAGGAQLTPLTTGRDNRSTQDHYRKILPLRFSPRAVVVPRPASLFPHAQRALVILRGGLTADSTGRTIPKLRRGDQVSEPPSRP